MGTIDFGAVTAYLGDLLVGAAQTVWISLLVYVLVIALGTVVALARYNRSRRIAFGIATVYVELFRNIPALVVLYLGYFGLPSFGIRIDNYVIGIAVLVIVIGAYLGESLRGALIGIPRGQWEAPQSTGFTNGQILRHIILPQMYQRAWPSLSNHLMIVLFATPLLSVIDVRELTSAAAEVNSETFRPVEVYVYAVVIYFVLGVVLQVGMAQLGKALFRRPGVGSAQLRGSRLGLLMAPRGRRNGAALASEHRPATPEITEGAAR